MRQSLLLKQQGILVEKLSKKIKIKIKAEEKREKKETRQQSKPLPAGKGICFFMEEHFRDPSPDNESDLNTVEAGGGG
jgi:hypothetical protein